MQQFKRLVAVLTAVWVAGIAYAAITPVSRVNVPALWAVVIVGLLVIPGVLIIMRQQPRP